jgi:hypothetical protein
MKTRRDVDRFEFTPPDTARVTAYLENLIDAGEGWINLLPGLEEEREETLGPSLFSFLSGARQPPVTMGTLMPPRPTRRAIEGVTVGLLHPAGTRVAARLADEGAGIPPNWVVRQDHVRRGLVVATPVGTGAEEIVMWSLRAGTLLCKEPMTGEWQAVVYLP